MVDIDRVGDRQHCICLLAVEQEPAGADCDGVQFYQQYHVDPDYAPGMDFPGRTTYPSWSDRINYFFCWCIACELARRESDRLISKRSPFVDLFGIKWIAQACACHLLAYIYSKVGCIARHRLWQPNYPTLSRLSAYVGR